MAISHTGLLWSLDQSIPVYVSLIALTNSLFGQVSLEMIAKTIAFGFVVVAVNENLVQKIREKKTKAKLANVTRSERAPSTHDSSDHLKHTKTQTIDLFNRRHQCRLLTEVLILSPKVKLTKNSSLKIVHCKSKKMKEKKKNIPNDKITIKTIWIKLFQITVIHFGRMNNLIRER